MDMPYPPASEAVDNHLAGAIEGLRGSMETGFDRVERRLDSMATKDAFNSEIARLDQRDAHLEDKMKTGFETLQDRMSEGFESIAERDRTRDAEAKKHDAVRDKKFARRMTWTISIVGLAFGAFQWVTSLLI